METITSSQHATCIQYGMYGPVWSDRARGNPQFFFLDIQPMFWPNFSKIFLDCFTCELLHDIELPDKTCVSIRFSLFFQNITYQNRQSVQNCLFYFDHFLVKHEASDKIYLHFSSFFTRPPSKYCYMLRAHATSQVYYLLSCLLSQLCIVLYNHSILIKLFISNLIPQEVV